MPLLQRLPSIAILTVLLVGLASVSGCDLNPFAKDSACRFTATHYNNSSLDVAYCVDVASEGECDDVGAEYDWLVDWTAERRYIEGERCNAPPDAPGGGGSEGCDSGDYTSGYGAGEEQVDLMCQTAWGYQCAGAEDAARATCQTIRDYVGSTSQCPYCP